MTDVRILARLDVKGPDLIKGINLEGVRKLGDPHDYARAYYADGIDEILYMDAVATLYGRNSLDDIVRTTAEDVFVPMTVGGGLKSIEDVDKMMRAGADKVAVNTAAIRKPELITQIAERFGSQAMVLSVEAKRKAAGTWEAYTDNGREKTGRDVETWVREAERRGVGEILLTSVDKEGMEEGFDLELIGNVAKSVSVPVIASGGMGRPEHLVELVKTTGADAVAIASIFHYKKYTLDDVRVCARANGIRVRENA